MFTAIFILVTKTSIHGINVIMCFYMDRWLIACTLSYFLHFVLVSSVHYEELIIYLKLFKKQIFKRRYKRNLLTKGIILKQDLSDEYKTQCMY